MPRVSQPLLLLVLLGLTASAQRLEGIGPNHLEPWLVGLTAVIVFLFVVFVILLANRLWQIRTRRKRGDLSDADSMEATGHANPAAEDSDEERDSKGQSKVTAF